MSRRAQRSLIRGYPIYSYPMLHTLPDTICCELAILTLYRPIADESVPCRQRLPTDSLLIGFFVADNLSHYLSSNLLFSTKVLCSVASVALLCKLPQFYTNLGNLSFAMNEKNGIGESKPQQSQRQGDSAADLSYVHMLLNRYRSVKY